MDKRNRMIVIGMMVAAVIIAIAMIAVIIGNNIRYNYDDSEQDSDVSESSEESSSADLSEVDVFIGLGDYKYMEKQVRAIQNGEMLGKVYQIRGIVSHQSDKYYIMEENAEGDKKVGVEFIIDGVDEIVYPKDGEPIMITGEVVETEPLHYIIKTKSEYVEDIVVVNDEEFESDIIREEDDF